MNAKTLRIECPCCGDEAWIGQDGDMVEDGQPLLCGCQGHISCDSETEPYAVADNCRCQEADGEREGQ